MNRRTHRSFVSYIDKSREYYAAQGYQHPYQWATADDVPFSLPPVPVTAARIGVVTTSAFPHGSEPSGVTPMGGTERLPTTAAFPAPTHTAADATHTRDLFWAKKETHTDDIGSYLPVAALERLVDNAQLGSLSDRFYGVPTEYSQRRTIERDAPLVEQWMREDDVDLALLVGL